MNSTVQDHVLCGWRLHSEIDLPELPPWRGDERAPEIEFVLGEVPANFEAPVLKTPIAQVDAAGRIRFGIEGVCDYLVENGNRITMAPVLRPEAPDIRLFLLGAGLGLLCHQRGIVPLHAAAVEVDGKAVLLAGPSGVGKSTLAAAFLDRGHRVLSDDVAPLDWSGPEPLILPSLQRIRLWRDSAECAGWSIDTLEPCRDDLQKFSKPLDAAHADVPLQPSALIHVFRRDERNSGIRFDRLRGVEAVQAMRQQIYRWRSLVGLIGRGDALRRVSQAAPLIPLHFSLRRPMRFRHLEETVDAVVNAVREAV